MSNVDGGEVLARFVESLVAEQEERKKSIEARGASVITSSGVLASLLLALVAFITRAEDFELPELAEAPLVAALALFTLAGIAGVLSNAPAFYKGVDAKDVSGVLKNQWGLYTVDEARQMIAVTRSKQLASAKRWNQAKGYSLLIAQSLQMTAVAALAVAVLQILRES